MAWLALAATLIGSYLIGSANGAVIISWLFGHRDVRKEGSGNAGMTNMLRVMGVVPGLLTFLIDALKGVAACLISKLWILPYIYKELSFELLRPEYAVYYVAVCCLIGHVYPVFFGFKGGKGVATTLGVGFICCWQTALVGLSIFIIVVAISKIVSLGSITAAVSLPFLNILFATQIEGAPHAVLIQCLLITLMSLNIIITHRTNIKRLLRHEEKKLTIKKSKEPK